MMSKSIVRALLGRKRLQRLMDKGWLAPAHTRGRYSSFREVDVRKALRKLERDGSFAVVPYRRPVARTAGGEPNDPLSELDDLDLSELT